jgi:hypothetical protein
LSTNWWVNQLTMADKTNHIMHISWDMDTKKAEICEYSGDRISLKGKTSD